MNVKTISQTSMRRIALRQLTWLPLILLLLLSLIGIQSAHAAGYVVNTAADSNDGSCGTPCSLRDAIIAANASAGADTITFDSSLSNATITLGSLLPNITDDLTIDGSSLTLPVTIDGAGTYRVFNVNSVTVTLDSLIISHGASSNGGGLYNNGGTLNITDSTFSDNSTACTGYICFSLGGGIYNSGTLNVTNSTFSDNNTACTGDTSSINPACASDGGGIYNQASGALTVTNSTFSGNSTTCDSAYCYSFGSGIFSSGTLTVANSTFSGNRATCTAAPCYSEGGGLINHGTLNITNSTFSDNSATCTGSNCFSLGGGIRNGGTLTGGTLTVTNSTFSGNSAACTGQSCHYKSGGIFDDSVNSSTYETGTLILTNTILANSTGGDCYTESDLASEKNNLIDDTGTDACDLTNGVNGDIIGSDPNLGPLADNGGPTQTMALQTGSVAIDAGDDAICAADPVNNLDQRGVTRPQGTHCDVGAFEAEYVDNTPPAITPTVSGTLGDNGWYTSDVQVSWTVSDDESAITSTTGCDATTINSDTTGATLTCEATSDGGTNSVSITIKRDVTPPTASASLFPAANANGWNNSDVIVSFSGIDDTSGIASCDGDVILSSDGSSQSASGTCSDNAGNDTTVTASGINIDKTDPLVSVTGVTDGATYPLGSVPTPACDTSDALSGVATPASLTVSGGNQDGTGTFTATCDGALDNAGNSGSASVTYMVITPQQAITDLENDIQSLVDNGTLKTGQANGLTHPLDNAIRSLDKGHIDDACNQLDDFIVKVGEKTPVPLDAATAAELIASAETIQTAIGCP